MPIDCNLKLCQELTTVPCLHIAAYRLCNVQVKFSFNWFSWPTSALGCRIAMKKPANSSGFLSSLPASGGPGISLPTPPGGGTSFGLAPPPGAVSSQVRLRSYSALPDLAARQSSYVHKLRFGTSVKAGGSLLLGSSSSRGGISWAQLAQSNSGKGLHFCVTLGGRADWSEQIQYNHEPEEC